MSDSGVAGEVSPGRLERAHNSSVVADAHAYETNNDRLNARTENIRGRCASCRTEHRSAESARNRLLVKANRRHAQRQVSLPPRRLAGRRA